MLLFLPVPGIVNPRTRAHPTLHYVVGAEPALSPPKELALSPDYIESLDEVGPAEGVTATIVARPL